MTPTRSYDEVVDAVMDGMEYYKGTARPDLLHHGPQLNMFKKAKDGQGRRLYANVSEVAQALGVTNIVTVEVMNDVTDLVGIIVNLADYNIGTDKGGEITRSTSSTSTTTSRSTCWRPACRARSPIKSAVVVKKTASTNVLAVPTKPAFVSSTGVVTIPTVTGVVYKNADYHDPHCGCADRSHGR
jgi:hypothetical protein